MVRNYPACGKALRREPLRCHLGLQFILFTICLLLAVPAYWLLPATPVSAGSLPALHPNPRPPQPPPPGWSELPIPGAYVTGLATDPTLSAGLFLTTLNGVFHSANGGLSWTPVAVLGTKPAFAVVSDSLQKLVYVAINGTPSIYASSNGGQTWKPMSNGLNVRLPACPTCSNDFIATSLAISPSNHFHLWAGGVFFGPGVFTDAVFSSLNNGLNWQQVNNAFGQGLNALVVATDSDKIAYVVQPTGGGVQKTGDSGKTWTQVALPDNSGDGQAVFVDPTQPTTVLISADGNNQSQIYRSLDRGQTWATVLQAPRSNPTGPGAGPFLILNTTIFVIMPDAIEFSADHGATWHPVAAPAPGSQVTALAEAGGRYYVGLDGAGVLSTTDGKNWHPSNNGLISGALLLATSRAGGGNLYAASLPASGSSFRLRAGRLFARSGDNGVTWLSFLSLPGLITLEPDPVQNGVLLAGTTQGLYRSTDGGLSWQPSGLAKRLVTGLRFAPGGDTFVYALADDTSGIVRTVYASSDSGKTWKLSNTGLPPLFDARQLVTSPGGSLLYVVGYNGAGIYRSANKGVSWAVDGNVPGIQGSLNYDQVAVSGNQVFALQSSNPGLLAVHPIKDPSWRTLPTPFRGATSIAIDPTQSGKLYAATSTLFRSSDSGASWEDLHFPGRGPLTSLLVIPGPFGTIVYTGNSIGLWRFR